MIYSPRQIHLGDQIEKKIDGRECSMCGGEEWCIVFWWGNLKEKEHLEEPGVDGRVILRWIFKKWDGGIECIYLAQDRGRWRALVDAAMKLRVP